MCKQPRQFLLYLRRSYFSTRKHPLTPMAKKAYEFYFGCKFRDQDKKWAPHVCCISCVTIRREWLNNKGRSVSFALPMIWREPTDHLTDCCFCIVPPLRRGITKKKRTVNYHNTGSSKRWTGFETAITYKVLDGFTRLSS